MKRLFPPPHILNHKTFGSNCKSIALPQETLHRSQNFYVYTQKYHTPPRNFAMLSQKFYVPPIKFALAHKSFALIRKKCCVSPINFAFACKTFSTSSKTFAFSRKVLKYTSWSDLIFPSQIYCEQTKSLFVFNITPASVAIFMARKMYG